MTTAGPAAETILTASGRVGLSDVVREGARHLAIRDYAQCEAEDFSGDSVRDIDLPEWLGDPSLLFPVMTLAELGLKVREQRHVRLYATCGVEEHIDDMDGLSVAVVLHSDGFLFKSAAQSLPLKTGEWFVFDDRLPHEATEKRTSTTLLVLTAPLEPI